jgi:hypothetical protein
VRSLRPSMASTLDEVSEDNWGFRLLRYYAIDLYG